MKKIWMFIAVLLIIGAVACEKDEPGAPIPGDGGVLLLELRLPDDAGTRSGVEVYAETTTEYPCIGYTIQTDHHDKDGLNISYGDIVRPSGPCATALDPAKSRVSFYDLEEGTHEVTITHKEETVNGTLEVTAEKYVLTVEENEVVRVVKGELDRPSIGGVE